MAIVIGIPKETKDGEERVGLTPQAVVELIRDCGVDVMFEDNVGGIYYSNTDYHDAGGKIVQAHPHHVALFPANLITKVKEPQLGEFDGYLKIRNHTRALAAFLHFPGNPWLKPVLDGNGVRYLAYEEVVAEKSGKRPILAAMSKIAGERAILEGFHYLSSTFGGRGIMPQDARVTIVGAGVAGKAAAHFARKLGVKYLVIMDQREIRDDLLLVSCAHRLLATPENLRQFLPKTDLLVSAVAQAGKPAPKIFTREMIALMPAGAFFADVAIDEEGSSETSHPTFHSKPIYVECGVIHYCVPNIPGAVPRTASVALSDAVLPYLKQFIVSLHSL